MYYGIRKKLHSLQRNSAKRNVKVLALSVDALDRHAGWVSDINENTKYFG
jgi:alkyl hydroperoxide reductase subunit AhpC